MINRIALITLLLIASPGGWAEEIRHSWCQGYIVRGLAEFPIQNLSRVDLWLDWNEVSQHNIDSKSFNQDQYQAGRDKFDGLFTAGNNQALIDTYKEDCAQVRNKFQWW
jgi:hypothetical protein